MPKRGIFGLGDHNNWQPSVWGTQKVGQLANLLCGNTLKACRKLAAIIQAHLIYQLAHKCQRSGRGLRFGAGLPEKSGLPDRKKQTLAVWHDLGLDGVPDAVLKHRGAEGKSLKQSDSRSRRKKGAKTQPQGLREK
ncbi:hypothetical protein, partial [Flavonifractor plautii]|uniref:hypothetical protein n=1 Tax=Flavonifractor plautii TaxID=292800 RepID=UPI001A9B78FB